MPNIDYTPAVFAAVKAHAESATDAAMKIADKTERNAKLDEVLVGIQAALIGTPDNPGAHAEQAGEVKKAFRSLQKEVVRRRIVNEGVRIDGRGAADLRPLSAEVGLLDTAHGTGLFQRGETQVLSVTTLAMPRMEQMLDTITLETKKKYMVRLICKAVAHSFPYPILFFVKRSQPGIEPIEFLVLRFFHVPVGDRIHCLGQTSRRGTSHAD